MKALILVGGFGTRLRPLTFSCPKPLVEFANKATVAHQIQALSEVGVTDIVLAVGFQPDAMIEPIKEFEKLYNVRITCSHEKEPLGTGGPLQLAKDLLVKDNKEGLIFVFNSDVICDFPLTELKKIHLEKKAEATLILTKVQDPSKYGVVVTNADNKIQSFVEKPQVFISDRINAGLYIFNTSVIDRIPLKFTMLEKDIFPQLAEEGKLFALDLKGFWMDVGQPKDYLKGTELYLNNLKLKNSQNLAHGDNIVGNVLISPSAKISPTAIIGPNVTIDADCVVEDGVRLKNTVVLKGCVIKSCSWIDNSIIGWKSSVGKWARIEGTTVLGEDVHVKDELYLNGIFVLPHKSITTNISEKGSIIM